MSSASWCMSSRRRHGTAGLATVPCRSVTYAAAWAPTSASSNSICLENMEPGLAASKPEASTNGDRLAAPRGGDLALVEALRELLNHVPGRSQPAETDAERAVAAELHDLLLGEVLAEVVVDGLVDREVIGRQELAVADGGLLGGAQVRRLIGLLE